MRDIAYCYPILREAWKYGQAKWKEINPNNPQVILTCTLRTLEEQRALFSQGRFPVMEVNRFRKLAGLSPISQAESKKKVTNCEPGDSKHNPDSKGLARAFDIGFINLSSGKAVSLNWDPRLFIEFYNIISPTFPTIDFGGNWTKFKDYPHFEIRG